MSDKRRFMRTLKAGALGAGSFSSRGPGMLAGCTKGGFDFELEEE